MAPTPFKEDAPRAESNEIFYYAQEDLLKQYAEKHNWRWLITRPNTIVGIAKGNFMNIAISIGIYAALQKQLGQPFKYPGNAKSWNVIIDQSSAVNNADFHIWAATTPSAGNNVYNIHNGDKVVVKDLWSSIAE